MFTVIVIMSFDTIHIRLAYVCQSLKYIILVQENNFFSDLLKATLSTPWLFFSSFASFIHNMDMQFFFSHSFRYVSFRFFLIYYSLTNRCYEMTTIHIIIIIYNLIMSATILSQNLNLNFISYI